MRLLLLCALILAGCAAPSQPTSTEALAEQKQRFLADRAKQRERDEEALRLALRQAYLTEHPALRADIRKAILDERLKVGMTTWDVIAAYSLWAYTTDPRVAKYRDSGVASLWQLLKHQPATADSPQEEWVLQRHMDLQQLYFQNGTLTRWKKVGRRQANGSAQRCFREAPIPKSPNNLRSISVQSPFNLRSGTEIERGWPAELTHSEPEV